jgi:hypothetical protein
VKNVLRTAIESWSICDLVERSYAQVTEDHATQDLMEFYPDPGASLEEWAGAARTIMEQDDIQISVAEGIERISVAESNHRLYLVYRDFIQAGKVADFEVMVKVNYVLPENLGDRAFERATGKNQAKYFRFLFDLNFTLKVILETIGYDVAGFDDNDYRLLSELVPATRAKKKKRTDDDRKKVQGTITDIQWKPMQELYAAFGITQTSSVSKVLDSMLDDVQITEDPRSLLSYGTGFSQPLAAVYEEAVTRFINQDSLATTLEFEQRPIMRQRLRELIETGIGRALHQRVVERLSAKIRMAESRSLTISALCGYLKVINIMSEGALHAGIQLRPLAETLGGRSYGHDKSSYGPTLDAYESLGAIAEPYRTELVVYLLDTTSALHDNKYHRRALARRIRSYARHFDSNPEQVVKLMRRLDLEHAYAYLSFATNFSAVETHQLSEHLLKLYHAAGMDDLWKLEKITSKVASELASARSATKTSFLVHNFIDMRDLTMLLNEYEVDLTHENEQATGQKRHDFDMVAGLPALYFGPQDMAVLTYPLKTTKSIITINGAGGGDDVVEASAEMRRLDHSFSKTINPKQSRGFLPDYLVAVLPNGNLMGIGVFDNDHIDIIAQFTQPLIINANKLVPPLYDPAKYALNLVCLSNLSTRILQPPSIIAANIYDPMLCDSVFAPFMIRSDGILAPVYARVRQLVG